jgi:hypothetical protein
MQTLNLHLLCVDGKALLANPHSKFAIGHKEGIARRTRYSRVSSKGQLSHTHLGASGYLGCDNLIIGRIDKRAARVLILRDTHL